MKQSYPNRIRARIAEIEATLASFDALRAELNELRIAERVLNKLAADDDNQPSIFEGVSSRNSKPLTVREALVRALSDAEDVWLTTEEAATAASAILQKAVPINTAGPNLTRLREDGVIVRDGPRVALRARVEKSEAPAEAEASHEVGGVAERLIAPDSESGGDGPGKQSPAGSNPATSAPSPQDNDIL